MLFRSEFKGLCYVAIRYVKDLDISKEIVQDAFMSLWEKRDTIDTTKSVKSYLSTSIRNKCLNWLRDNKKFSNDLLGIEEILKDTVYEQHDRLVFSEINNSIEEAMTELPEKCREIFILSRFNNLKYHEIATRLDISIKTVETQISKALQHMRFRLKEYLTILILLGVNFLRLFL